MTYQKYGRFAHLGGPGGSKHVIIGPEKGELVLYINACPSLPASQGVSVRLTPAEAHAIGLALEHYSRDAQRYAQSQKKLEDTCE